MNDIPPKQTPDASSGNLVAMYQASGLNAESFPVLKAFQDYIDAERAQARKRVLVLSISFSAVLCTMVLVFLGTIIYLLKSKTESETVLQTKLIEATLAAQKQAATPPAAVPQPAPQPIIVQAPPAAPATPPAAASKEENEQLRQVTKALADLKADIEKKKNDEAKAVALAAQKQAEKQAAEQAAELEKLQKEIGTIKKENQMLKESFVTQRKQAQQPKTAAVKPAPAPTPKPPAPAKTEAQPKAPDASTVAAATLPPPAPAVESAAFPPATKEPPVTPPGVKALEPQKGMMATAIPLTTKNIGTVPWRVVIPE
jgi:DNA polymerase III gamma/tau subunit